MLAVVRSCGLSTFHTTHALSDHEVEQIVSNFVAHYRPADHSGFSRAETGSNLTPSMQIRALFGL